MYYWNSHYACVNMTITKQKQIVARLRAKHLKCTNTENKGNSCSISAQFTIIGAVIF